MTDFDPNLKVQVGSPKQAALTLRILHAALTFSIIIYGVMAYVVNAESPKSDLGSNDLLVAALGVVGLSIGVAVLPLLRGKLMPPIGDRRRREPADALNSAEKTALGRYFSACITTWAMCEVPAVFGLIAALITHYPTVYLPFGGLSLLLMALHPPKMDAILGVVEAASSDR